MSSSSAAQCSRVILVMIVKNEGRIIDRVMRSCAGLVSGYCICDTGSSDDTIARIKSVASELDRPCVVPVHPWKNFGHNRSLSFVESVRFADAQGWSRSSTWGLLLDGDMILQLERDEATIRGSLSEMGYVMIQRNGPVEYWNQRLVRLDGLWKCIGSTHEYWACAPPLSHPGHNKTTATATTPSAQMPPTMMYIRDVGDGGAKADKYERDIRMLSEEIASDPANHRAHFYLAQSYHNSGKFEQAIPIYRKRMTLGGWSEEVWYSQLSIGRCHMALKQYADAECAFVKAFEMNPSRAEPLHNLIQHFRETNQPYKGWHYLQLALPIPKPTDGLFIESDVYDYKVRYEHVALMHGVDKLSSAASAKPCLGAVIQFMAIPQVPPALAFNVYMNMPLYIFPLPNSSSAAIDCLRPMTHDGTTFYPSSISLIKDSNPMSIFMLANVRYVDYRMAEREENQGKDVYIYPPQTGRARTFNRLCYVDVLSMEIVPHMITSHFWDLSPPDRPRAPAPPCRICGLEDVRLIAFSSPTSLEFTATQMEFSGRAPYDRESPTVTNTYRILRGTIDIQSMRWQSGRVLHPPAPSSPCEKSWIFVGGREFIHSWHPLTIVREEEGPHTTVISRTFETPYLWSHFRGSSSIVHWKGDIWCVVHFKYVRDEAMTYIHSVVRLDSKTCAPLGYSNPFVFSKINDVEFCLGFDISWSGKMTFFYSSRDRSPARITIDADDLQWHNIN